MSLYVKYMKHHRWGTWGIGFLDEKVVAINLDLRDKNDFTQSLRRRYGQSVETSIDGRSHVIDVLQSYMKGDRVDLNTIAITLHHTTSFQRKVYEMLRTVGYGERISYRGLAERVHGPSYARAVAQALHVNRIPLLIPCHRVVQTNGAIGGFAAGVALKEHLLVLEQNVCANLSIPDDSP